MVIEKTMVVKCKLDVGKSLPHSVASTGSQDTFVVNMVGMLILETYLLSNRCLMACFFFVDKFSCCSASGLAYQKLLEHSFSRGTIWMDTFSKTLRNHYAGTHLGNIFGSSNSFCIVINSFYL